MEEELVEEVEEDEELIQEEQKEAKAALNSEILRELIHNNEAFSFYVFIDRSVIGNGSPRADQIKGKLSGEHISVIALPRNVSGASNPIPVFQSTLVSQQGTHVYSPRPRSARPPCVRHPTTTFLLV